MACWTAPSAAVHNGFTMQARAFWRTVTVDRSDLLDRFLRLLASERVRWCVVGGLGVNPSRKDLGLRGLSTPREQASEGSRRHRAHSRELPEPSGRRAERNPRPSRV